MGRPDLKPCPRQCTVWPNAIGIKFSMSIFFVVFNEKITGRRQFRSNEQILLEHVKTRDFYTDLHGFLIFEKMDFYHYHLATLVRTRIPIKIPAPTVRMGVIFFSSERNVRITCEQHPYRKERFRPPDIFCKNASLKSYSPKKNSGNSPLPSHKKFSSGDSIGTYRTMCRA